MSELANILQTVNIPPLVIQLGVKELEKREARMAVVRYCHRNDISIPRRKRPIFVFPSTDYWRANLTYAIFSEVGRMKPVLNRINKIILFWDI